jgi:hypothetical protein
VVSLIGQMVAVAAAALLMRALLERAGMRVGLPRAAALAVVLLLSVLSLAHLRESWHALDVQRTRYEHFSRERAGFNCAVNNEANKALGWIGSKLPTRSRFYLQIPGFLPGNGELCLRFVMLPRLQVPTLAQAQYVVFWKSRPPALVASLRARGATFSEFRRNYAVAKLP